MMEQNESEVKFVHQPLVGDDIRIIKIQPGPIGSSVQCTLQHVPFASSDVEKYDYVALSYVWSSPEPGGNIWMDGKPFYVSHNLLEALDELRTHCEHLTKYSVWVDAICINQTDVNEKSKQVLRMTDIYGNALRVVAWLGPVVPADEDTVQIHFNMALACWPGESDEGFLEEEKERALKSLEPVTLSKERMDVIRFMVDRPWFHRVWTFQEAVLGRQLQCRLYAGRHSVPLNCYLTLALSYLEFDERHLYNLSQLYGLQLLKRTRKDVVKSLRSQQDAQAVSDTEAAIGLLRLLCGTSFRQCSVMQDYVYGILGVWKVLYAKEPSDILLPDYSLSYELVYWIYASWLITQTGSLRVFSMSRPLRTSTVPSWVPDFSNVEAIDLEFDKTERTVSISSDFMELYVTGYLVGHFQAINLAYRSAPSGAIEEVISWLTERIISFEKNIVIPAAGIKNCSTQLILDAWMEGAGDVGDASSRLRRRIYELARPTEPTAAISIEPFRQMRDTDGIKFTQNLAAIVGLIRGHQYLLDTGEIASSSSRTVARMQEGDRVYYLTGSNALGATDRHVLRPSADNRYLLLGTVFLSIHYDVTAAWKDNPPYMDGEKWMKEGMESLVII